jgi:hypothetical protein
MKSALALGNDKPLRLIRAASKDRNLLEEIGLLHSIGHDDYRSRAELTDILRRPFKDPPWPWPKRNREQLIYILQSSQIDDLHRRSRAALSSTRWRLVVTITFAAVPQARARDSDMLYRVQISPRQLITRQSRSGGTMDEMRQCLGAVKQKYWRIRM